MILVTYLLPVISVHLSRFCSASAFAFARILLASSSSSSLFMLHQSQSINRLLSLSSSFSSLPNGRRRRLIYIHGNLLLTTNQPAISCKTSLKQLISTGRISSIDHFVVSFINYQQSTCSAKSIISIYKRHRPTDRQFKLSSLSNLHLASQSSSWSSTS